MRLKLGLIKVEIILPEIAKTLEGFAQDRKRAFVARSKRICGNLCGTEQNIQKNGTQSVQAALDKLGIEVSFVSIRTAQAAATAVVCAISQIVKSLILKQRQATSLYWLLHLAPIASRFI